MAYINTSTLEYPLFQGDIRLACPTIGDPFVLPDGYAEVQWVDPPVVVNTDVVPTEAPVETQPQLVGDVWTMTWQVMPYDQATIDAMKARLPPDPKLDAKGSTPNVIQ